MDVHPKRFVSWVPVIQATHRICEYCLQSKPSNKELLRCSACRRASYCSAACQKKDWKVIHKELCKGMQGINRIEVAETPSSGKFTMEEYCDLLWHRQTLLAMMESDKELYFLLHRYLQNGIKCRTCYLTPRQKISADVPIFPCCPRCELAFWCSDDCKQSFSRFHDKAECDVLREIHCVERMTIDYRLKRGGAIAIMYPSPEPRPRFTSVTSFSGWDDYLKEVVPDFHQCVQRTAREFSSTNKDARLAVTVLGKEAMVLVLTTAVALEHALPDLADRTSLCIHFIGACTREAESAGMMEELLHLYPTIKKLDVCYIGPECIAMADEGRSATCPVCSRKGRQRIAHVSPSSYETCQWAPNRSARNALKPDLAVAFNTGMCEMATDGWTRVLKVLLDARVPSLFTSYSLEESRLEEEFLRKLNANFIRVPQKNKWRGVARQPNIYLKGKTRTESDHYSLTYNSHYTVMFRGRNSA